MTRKERKMLLSAIDNLEHETCEWENAMAILYTLAGLKYNDHRKLRGTSINIFEFKYETYKE